MMVDKQETVIGIECFIALRYRRVVAQYGICMCV